jgi:cardiolipin synthase A/B
MYMKKTPRDDHKQLMNWKFHLFSEKAWHAALDVCNQATTSIDFEQFFFKSTGTGEIGDMFLEVFLRKAREGVRVRIILDAVSYYFIYTSPRYDDLVDAGVSFGMYSVHKVWDYFNPLSFFLRDHRKLLVVDSTHGFIGGVVQGEDAREWRDTLVELQGPVVNKLQEAFDTMWNNIRSYFTVFEYRVPRPTEGMFIVAANSIRRKEKHINKLYLDAFRGAKKNIFITTPYFSPDRRFLRILVLARKRGVDVRILVPKKSDFKIADLVKESYYKKLLRHGVKIYEYTESFIHAKTVVVDDDWSSVGSYNFDKLSMWFNHELTLVSYHKKFVQELTQHFLDDMSLSIEITKRKWKKRSWKDRFLHIIVRPFRLFV